MAEATATTPTPTSTSTAKAKATMEERYKAAMVLSGVGDALGYHAGQWEFETSGERIHRDLNDITDGKGVTALHIAGSGEWRVSDDTVMHAATAEGLADAPGPEMADSLQSVAKSYVGWWNLMDGRAPGYTCAHGVSVIAQDGSNWDTLPFDNGGGGCGAAMRAACIGLRWPAAHQLDLLAECAVETGRMTHHNGTGYLGALAAALFTSYAIRGVPVAEWGWRLLSEGVPAAERHIRKSGRFVQKNIISFKYFVRRWTEYLELRRIASPGSSGPAVFPVVWDVAAREDFYKWASYSGWGGSSGHDAPMIAYDALLWSGDSWEKLCLSGMLHGGDNDSTGAIAGALFGASFGFSGVPELNYRDVEFHEVLDVLGEKLLAKAVADGSFKN